MGVYSSCASSGVASEIGVPTSGTSSPRFPATALARPSVQLIRYARKGIVKQHIPGTRFASLVKRSGRDRRRLHHLGKNWCLIYLHQHLFFASVAACVAPYVCTLQRHLHSE